MIDLQLKLFLKDIQSLTFNSINGLFRVKKVWRKLENKSTSFPVKIDAHLQTRYP
jgi:hypothetical protein